MDNTKSKFEYQIFYFLIFHLIKDENLDEIESAIEDYRKRQRQRYLKYKNESNVNIMNDFSKKDISCESKIARSNSVRNKIFTSKARSSTSSSLMEHDINNEINQRDSKLLIRTEHDNLSKSLREQDRDSENSLRLPDELYDEVLITDNIDCPSHHTFSLENRNSRVSQDFTNVEERQHFKRNTSSSNSGIFNSLRSWASSIVNHNSRSESTSPRPSRFLRYMHLNRRSIGGNNRSNQSNNTSSIQNESPIYGENLSDEELARRIQMEELSGVNELENATGDRIHFPIMHSYGFFQNEIYPLSRTSIPSSSNFGVAPFHGSPYKIDISKSSEDESNEVSRPSLKH